MSGMTTTPMRKRKEFFPNLNDEPNIHVERNEIVKLTKVAKSWDFTCSFCFKKFPSAQAMGGHQNAHRSQRLEEKRFYIRDPIGYRKRAFLKALKGESSLPVSMSNGGPLQTNAVREFNNAPRVDGNNKLSYNFYGEGCSTKYGLKNMENKRVVQPCRTLNFFPPKELNLADRVGVDSEDAKGKGKVAAACMAAEVAGNGRELDEVKLDLALKL